MKMMRLGILIVSVGCLWGCGTAPDEIRESPPVTAAPPPPVTPNPHVTPTVIPGCRVHKLCE